jgi:hypothetical protein
MCFYLIERIPCILMNNKAPRLAVGGCSREQVSSPFIVPPLRPLEAGRHPTSLQTEPLQGPVFSSTLVSIAVIQELIRLKIEEPAPCLVPSRLLITTAAQDYDLQIQTSTVRTTGTTGLWRGTTPYPNSLPNEALSPYTWPLSRFATKSVPPDRFGPIHQMERSEGGSGCTTSGESPPRDAAAEGVEQNLKENPSCCTPSSLPLIKFSDEDMDYYF